MIEGFAYFPAVVYRDERPDWVGHLISVSQTYFDDQPSSTSLCQTINMDHDLGMKFLSDYLLDTGREILQGQGYSMDKYDLYLSGLWGQEVKGHNGTNIHVHKNSQLCGWIFLEAHQGGSYPIYYDTRANKQMVELDYFQGKEITNATSVIHFNNIIPGTILIANSWMQHQLTPNMTDKPTKAIHFVISHRDR